EPEQPQPARPVSTVPRPRLTLAPVAPLTLEAGSRRSLEVSLTRQGFEGSVLIEVQQLPDSITIPDKVLGVGEGQTSLDVTAAADAVPGNIDVLLVAHTAALSAQQRLRLVILARPEPPVPIVLGPPPAAQPFAEVLAQLKDNDAKTRAK